jgi:hypothetical protein
MVIRKETRNRHVNLLCLSQDFIKCIIEISYLVVLINDQCQESIYFIAPRGKLTRQESSEQGKACHALLELSNARSLDLYLSKFCSMSRNCFFVGGDTNVGSGGGKYIMSLVKLSFYDHFMVVRGPSMLSTYRCAFLTAALGARADSSRISFIICIDRTL